MFRTRCRAIAELSREPWMMRVGCGLRSTSGSGARCHGSRYPPTPSSTIHSLATAPGSCPRQQYSEGDLAIGIARLILQAWQTSPRPSPTFTSIKSSTVAPTPIARRRPAARFNPNRSPAARCAEIASRHRPYCRVRLNRSVRPCRSSTSSPLTIRKGSARKSALPMSFGSKRNWTR